jgi:hypothetical protein
MGDVEPCDTQSDSDRPRDMDDVPCDSQSDSDHSVASSAESSALSSRVACARDEVVAPVVSDTSGSKRKRSIEGHVLEPSCAVFGAGLAPAAQPPCDYQQYISVKTPLISPARTRSGFKKAGLPSPTSPRLRALSHCVRA